MIIIIIIIIIFYQIQIVPGCISRNNEVHCMCYYISTHQIFQYNNNVLASVSRS